MSLASLFFTMVRITVHRDFKALDIIKHRSLVEIRHYPVEIEIYLAKNVLVVGNFGELCAAWCEG